MRCTRNVALGLLAISVSVLHPVHAADAYFDTAHFSGSGNCGLCHNGLFDAERNDVSIETEWSATMMANAARDPLWRAKFASEMRRNPGRGRPQRQVHPLPRPYGERGGL